MPPSDKLVSLLPALGLLAACADRSADFVLDEGADEVDTGSNPDEGTDDCPNCPSDDGGGAFYITEVSPAQGSTLTLSFSEPVGSLAGVDPNDFRISVATSFWAYQYGKVYQSSQYIDLATYEELPYPTPYVQFAIDALEPGEAANELVLQLARNIPPSACETIESFNSQPPPFDAEFEKLMLLHHDGGEIPIHSIDDVPLGDFGAAWVSNPSWAYSIEEAEFPNLGVRVEIPCP